MALDINGYNSVFKAFVDFAQQKSDAGKQTAVVNAAVKHAQPLEGRAILSLGTSKTVHVHNWLRMNDEYAVNDRTRTIFRNAVANMFGGESKIPADVKKAMLLSVLMHQGSMQFFVALAMKAPADPGTVAPHELPGGNLFASRDMMSGHFMIPLVDDSSMDVTIKLDVAPDGNTATMTITANPGLTEGVARGDNFGQVQLTQRMTVDLRPDVPVVTDVKVSQKLVA